MYLVTRIIFIASLLVSSDSWGNREEKDIEFTPSHHGELVFVSSSGELKSDSSLKFNEKEKYIRMEKFSADSFWGDSINFRGREIKNAALVDSTVEGLKHLTVDSIAIRSQKSSGKNGFGLAMIDNDGILSATHHLRLDEKTLKIAALEAFSSSGIEIGSDVDFKSHTLKNAKLDTETVLNNLSFRGGYIEDSILHNVTATGLKLGEIKVDSISISEFDSPLSIGSLLCVGDNGSVQVSPNIKHEKDGSLHINSEVVLLKSIDFKSQNMMNVQLTSGTIDGPIDVSVHSIYAKELHLKGVQEDKTVLSDGLAILGLDGKLGMSPISIDKDGNLGDFKVLGTIDFTQSGFQSHGKLNGPHITGGKITDIEYLKVNGDTDLESGLHVSGEAYIDGSVTVSGSVLGSGPYVDISDKRLKRNIQKINSTDALEKLLQLQGVLYDLDFTEVKSPRRFGKESILNPTFQRRQLGLIAQDVEKVLPELVFNDKDGFKGLQYSRLAPIFVETLKQVILEMRRMEENQSLLREEQRDLKRTIQSLIESSL